MKLFPITLAMGLAMASTFALASSHGTPPAEAAKPMPCMGMGMGMDMDAMFTQVDANSDGSVSKAEFDAHHTAMMAKRRAMMDGMHKQMPPAAAPAATPATEHKH